MGDTSDSVDIRGAIPASPARAEIHKKDTQALGCENLHNIRSNVPVSIQPEALSDRRPLDVMCEMIDDIEQILSDAVLEANERQLVLRRLQCLILKRFCVLCRPEYLVILGLYFRPTQS